MHLPSQRPTIESKHAGRTIHEVGEAASGAVSVPATCPIGRAIADTHRGVQRPRSGAAGVLDATTRGADHARRHGQGARWCGMRFSGSGWRPFWTG